MTGPELRQRIREDIGRLRRYGALPSGRYGFVHGKFALSGGDPKYCRILDEIDILAETGCYADFTFGALGSAAQPRQVNSIYYPVSDGTSKSYDAGPEATVGQGRDGLLIVPGPMCFGLFPRVLDDGNVGPHYPPSPRRITRWLKAHVHVRGRPNWIFIKVYAHSARDADRAYLFDGPVQGLWQALEDRLKAPDARLHYVTAREACNIIKAAEAGRDGDPNDYRDFLIPAPASGAARGEEASWWV